MKYAYDEFYFPAIPILQIRLSTPEWNLQTTDLPAIVDTGADATLVPLKYLLDIEATIGGRNRLRSQWGERREVNLYLVDLEIEQAILPGIWVIGDELSDEVILGRNVLNRLRLLLDGPAGKTTLYE